MGRQNDKYRWIYNITGVNGKLNLKMDVDILFFTARRHASAAYAVVCLYVCHKSVFYWNG